MIPILSSRGTSAAGNVSALVVADASAEAPDREVSRRRNRKRKRARGKNPDTQRSTPWMDSLPMTEYESNEQRLHDEIVAFVEYVRPTRQETSVRELVLAKVEEVIRRCFSNCNITVFGSMAHELYLPEDDMDLAVDTLQVYQDTYRTTALLQLSSSFKRAQMTTEFHVAVGARVPVLSSETIPELGSIKLNISINSNDGVKAIPVIKRYLDEMPALRHLVLVINYATICLAIHLLQVNPGKRPTAHLENPMENELLGFLLIDFFDYYGNQFRYDTDCVSVTTGSLISKEVKRWNNEQNPDALSIECLLHPENDIGEAAGKIRQIRAAFQSAYTALMEDYPFSVESGSILGGVVRISDKTIAHRDELTRLVDSGELKKRLDGLLLPTVYEPPPNPRYFERSLKHQAHNESIHTRRRYVERYTEAQAPNGGDHWSYDPFRSSYSDERKNDGEFKLFRLRLRLTNYTV